MAARRENPRQLADYDGAAQFVLEHFDSDVVRLTLAYIDEFGFIGYDANVLFKHLKDIAKDKQVLIEDCIMLCMCYAVRGTKLSKIVQRMGDVGKAKILELQQKYQIKDSAQGKNSTTVTLGRVASLMPPIPCQMYFLGKGKLYNIKTDLPAAYLCPAAVGILPKAYPVLIWKSFEYHVELSKLFNPKKHSRSKVRRFFELQLNSTTYSEPERLHLAHKFLVSGDLEGDQAWEDGGDDDDDEDGSGKPLKRDPGLNKILIGIQENLNVLNSHIFRQDRTPEPEINEEPEASGRSPREPTFRVGQALVSGPPEGLKDWLEIREGLINKGPSFRNLLSNKRSSELVALYDNPELPNIPEANIIREQLARRRESKLVLPSDLTNLYNKAAREGNSLKAHALLRSQKKKHPKFKEGLYATFIKSMAPLDVCAACLKNTCDGCPSKSRENLEID